MYDLKTLKVLIEKVTTPTKTWAQFREMVVAIFVIIFNTFMSTEKVLILPDLTGMKSYVLKHATLLEYFKGFKVMVIDDNDLNFIAAAMQPLIGGETVIIVNQIFLDYLTEKEQNAILAHEVAHIKLKHLEGHGFGFINMPQAELEADAYAAKICGAKNLISALKKLVIGYNTSRPDIEGQVHEIFAPRLAALGAIMK